MESGRLTATSRGSRFLSIVALATGLALAGGCKKEEPPAPPPPAEVVAVKVTPRTVPSDTVFVAQAESSHQVEILARVSGFLDKIRYKEGDMMRAGQVMFQIDPKPFQAQVDAAKGEVENRKAQHWTAWSNLERIKPLAEQDAASQSDLDNAIGAVKSAEAALHSAKAHLDKMELDLGYTTIYAPVKGVSGEALFREGAYLPAGSRLSYVARIDPIWVDFSVSQNQMAQIRQDIAAGELIAPADNKYQVEVKLSDGTLYPHVGQLNFVSPTFNQDTGTFLVRAELANPDGELRPGMFVTATVKGATRPNALTVPQKAVQQTSNGHVVFLVSHDGTAEVRPVIVGEWVGDDWIIRQGLKADEQVIVEGFQRLKPGAPVKVVEPVAAAAESAEKQEQTAPPAAETAGKTESTAAPATPAGK